MTREAALRESPKARPEPKAAPQAKAGLDSKARAAPEHDGEPQRPKKRGRGLLVALLGVLALAAAGAWLLAKDEAEPKAATADSPEAASADKPAKPDRTEPAKPPQFVALEALTVNLREDGSAEHYLQVGVTYQVSGAQVADAMKLHMPVIRSNILLLLSSKAPKEIATLQGKTKLSEELLVAARQPLPGDEDSPKGVTAVHYSSFIIQ
jgi:flagellar FliL protein